MYKIIITAIRPSTDVEFFSVFTDSLADFRSHWNETYFLTNKVTRAETSLSIDKLSQTTTQIWNSEESYNEAMADPIVMEFYKTRKDYNDSHGIIIENIVTTLG